MIKTSIPNVNINWKSNDKFDLCNNDNLNIGQIYSVCVSPISTQYVWKFRSSNIVLQMKNYNHCIDLTATQCSQVVQDYYDFINNNSDFSF